MVIKVVDVLFYLFSSILLISSLMVILVQNTMYSVLFLILSFISSASILFLLECDFFALIFIMIYIGAIAVLFLFVIMMLDVKQITVKKSFLKYFPFGSLLGFTFLIEVLLIFFEAFNKNPYLENSEQSSNFYINWFDKIDAISEIEAIGQVLYTDYVLQFLVAGNILLLSVVGAVVLTLNTKAMKNNRKQIIFRQLSRNYKNVLLSSGKS